MDGVDEDLGVEVDRRWKVGGLRWLNGGLSAWNESYNDCMRDVRQGAR